MPNDARRIGRLVSVRAEGSSVTERDRPQAAHVAFEASGGHAPAAGGTGGASAVRLRIEPAAPACSRLHAGM
ncbi:hypothetical protein WS73_25595 [Burkholderia savannae]|nr:hypothetical protein WS73_25595 [Burkholderia savannae]